MNPVRFIDFNGGDYTRDLFQGRLKAPRDVELCPYCDRPPVYCFPYKDLTDIEIYCKYCGTGRHSNDIDEAVERWNDFCRSERWLRHLSQERDKKEK